MTSVIERRAFLAVSAALIAAPLAAGAQPSGAERLHSRQQVDRAPAHPAAARGAISRMCPRSNCRKNPRVGGGSSMR
jgi:hypothetical protein